MRTLKIKTLGLTLLVLTVVFTGACSSNGNEQIFDESSDIHLITREDGSGTRGAFTELTGIFIKEGKIETDQTYAGATIQNGTNSVMTTVAGDITAMSYTSVGSLNKTIKAIKVGGFLPTAKEIKEGTYDISRPFNVAHKGTLSEVAEDFWTFLFSSEGQKIVSDKGYIEGEKETSAYEIRPEYTGSISVVGSTSVTPLLEAIADAYKQIQPNVTIDITSNGSSAGMTAVLDGSADIGMASRSLKAEEKTELSHQALAIDGIAVIVNPNNPINDLTLEEVRQIFTGEIKNWSELIVK